MASYRPDLGGGLSAAGASRPSGPLMTLADWGALASAPRRPAGTRVTVQAKRVAPQISDMDLPFVGRVGGPDHMFLQYDDGQDQLIARGGPSRDGLAPFVAGSLDGSNRVTAGVVPAEQSPDFGRGYRTLASTFLPGVTAEQAAQAARQHAEGVRHGGNGYGLHTNSNSYAADVAQPIFGYRPGDEATPGYLTHLRDDGAPPPSLVDRMRGLGNQLPDITPYLRYPAL